MPENEIVYGVTVPASLMTAEIESALHKVIAQGHEIGFTITKKQAAAMLLGIGGQRVMQEPATAKEIAKRLKEKKRK